MSTNDIRFTDFEPFVDADRCRGTSVDAGRYELHLRLTRNTNASPRLSCGDVDAQWEMAESSGDETAGASCPTPDQNVVDEVASALGIRYHDAEELKCGEKERDRDRRRWELDPASAEDYRERMSQR